jgi:hypothetical protein
MMKKRLLALACEALARNAYAAAAISPHTVTVQLFRQGLHNDPKCLRELLQEQIDLAEADEFEAILLVCGLCGGSTSGLAARHIPLVIPRAHDCITLYLGSKERYLQEFTAIPGTYWYSLDYLEHSSDDGNVALGASSQAKLDEAYEDYVNKFGEENADYLMKVMGSWQQHYTRAVYIDMGLVNDNEYEQRAKKTAQQRGWSFQRLLGDRTLINKLIWGDWNQEDFLYVPPGYTIEQSTDPKAIVQERIGKGDS